MELFWGLETEVFWPRASGRHDNLPPSKKSVGRHHAQELKVTMLVNNYFLERWPFPDESAKLKFAAERLPTWHCCLYPSTSDDRVVAACRFTVMLFLVDDMLKHMSPEDRSSYSEHLISIVKGGARPADDKPVEKVVHEVWEGMRAIDKPLADGIEEPAFVFWRSPNDPSPLTKKSNVEYLKYQRLHVASQALLALQRFSQGISLTKEELASVADLETLYTDHIALVHDLMSWEKECRASKEMGAEVSVVSNMVPVFSDKTGIRHDVAKKVLWNMCRDWERQYDVFVAQRLEKRCSGALKQYMSGIELQMCGNELWSRTTFRYNAPSLK